MRGATGTVTSGKVILGGPVMAGGTDVYLMCITRGASDATVLSDDELETGRAEGFIFET
jgi:hypothetical protein